MDRRTVLKGLSALVLSGCFRKEKRNCSSSSSKQGILSQRSEEDEAERNPCFGLDTSSIHLKFVNEKSYGMYTVYNEGAHVEVEGNWKNDSDERGFKQNSSLFVYACINPSTQDWLNNSFGADIIELYGGEIWERDGGYAVPDLDELLLFKGLLKVSERPLPKDKFHFDGDCSWSRDSFCRKMEDIKWSEKAREVDISTELMRDDPSYRPLEVIYLVRYPAQFRVIEKKLQFRVDLDNLKKNLEYKLLREAILRY